MRRCVRNANVVIDTFSLDSRPAFYPTRRNSVQKHKLYFLESIMKRFMVLLLVLSLLIGAVFTIGAQDEDVYYMIGGNLGHPWWKQHFEGIEVAAEWLGINVEIVGPPPTDGIALEQIKLLEEIVAKPNTAGIMMIGFDVTLIPEVSKQAMAAGIPFIQFNGDLIDKSARHAFVGTGDFRLRRIRGAVGAGSLS